MLSDLQWNSGGSRVLPKRGEKSPSAFPIGWVGPWTPAVFSPGFHLLPGFLVSCSASHANTSFSLLQPVLNCCRSLHPCVGVEGTLRLLHSCHFCLIPLRSYSFSVPLSFLTVRDSQSMVLWHYCLVTLCYSLLYAFLCLLSGLFDTIPLSLWLFPVAPVIFFSVGQT